MPYTRNKVADTIPKDAVNKNTTLQNSSLGWKYTYNDLLTSNISKGRSRREKKKKKNRLKLKILDYAFVYKDWRRSYLNPEWYFCWLYRGWLNIMRKKCHEVVSTRNILSPRRVKNSNKKFSSNRFFNAHILNWYSFKILMHLKSWKTFSFHFGIKLGYSNEFNISYLLAQLKKLAG